MPIFKEYTPRYDYKYLCTEDDDYKYYQALGLKLFHRGFFGQYNYGLPLKQYQELGVKCGSLLRRGFSSP